VPTKKTKKKTKKKTTGALQRRVASLENEFSSIMRALQDKTQPIVKNKAANTYVATVSFSADRRLTEAEVDRLSCAIHVQVEDPAGLDGEKRALFEVSDVKTMIRRTRKINRRRK